MNAGFWRGRRVFVTGHTGFKGAWLALLLQRLGAKVTGFALEAEHERGVFAAAGVARGMRSLAGDIRDAAALATALAQAEPEVVLHLAAQALVFRAYEQPLDTYTTNVIGTATLLDAVRQLGGPRTVLVVTTDKVYDNQEWVWGYRESDALGGYDPYSSSKACCELVTAAYRQSFLKQLGIGVATARAGNVIGGGDWAQHRIVPDFVRAAYAGGVLRVRSPHSTRPWQHVLEPVEGYLLLAERLAGAPEFAEPWNFGPAADAIRPVGVLVADLAKAWGRGAAAWEQEGAEKRHEAGVLCLDAAKANKRLGWVSRLGYAKGVQWTAEWYQAQQRGEDMERFTLAQIDDYLGLPV